MNCSDTIIVIDDSPSCGRPPSTFRVLCRLPAVICDILRRWRRRIRSRRELAAMDPRLLKDIGLDPGAVWRETEKPFWKP